MPTTSTTPLEAATAESADALATMEADAADYFAARDAARSAEPLNPVAPALEKAVAPPAPAAKPAAKPAVAKPKSSGAPQLITRPSGTTPSPTNLDATAAPAADATAAKPAAPPTPPPADPKFDDTGLPRQYAPGTRAANWDKLHAKADHYEALSTARHGEIEALQAALAEARTTSSTTPAPEITARLDSLQKERDALRTQLETVAGERLFDTESKPRREAALLQARAAVGPEASDQIAKILALPEGSYRDEQIESLHATLPPVRANRLMQAVGELDRIALERNAAAAQGGERWNARLAQAQEAESRRFAKRTAHATSTFETELKEWAVAGVTPEEVAEARSVYTGKNATLLQASRAALWGAVGPRVAQVLSNTQARVAELEGELSRLRGAQPGVGAAASGTLPTTNGEGNNDDPSITGYAERIARQAARAGVRFGA